MDLGLLYEFPDNFHFGITCRAEADFDAIVCRDKTEFLDRVLSVLENEVVPKTMEGIRAGNRLFGAAVLNKSDHSTVIAGTNTETSNPLFHDEVTAIRQFYDLSDDQRPSPKDTIFNATHEPCPLCLSSVTLGGMGQFLLSLNVPGFEGCQRHPAGHSDAR